MFHDKIITPNKKQMRYLLIAQFIMIFGAFVSNLFAMRTIQFFTITAVAGNLLFPICYSMSDIVGEFLSMKRVAFLVFISYGIQMVIFGFAYLAQMFAVVPGNEVGAQAFSVAFGFIPRVVLASFTAFLIGSLTNAFVLKALPHNKFGFKTRAVLSTIVGEFFDTWVFLAVLGVSIGWLNAVKLTAVKTGVEALILPATDKIKRVIENAH